MAEEEEAIAKNIILYESNYDEQYAIGTKLYDKTMENSTIWDIIVTKEPQGIYGTNWNYVEKETEVKGYGKTKYEWLVNYETGEVTSLKEDGYTRLTHGMELGETEGLIFNLDPSIISDGDIDNLKNGSTSVLGKDTELINFNWTENSGLTPKSFNFDGVDDYIKVKYDNTQEKQKLAQRGFTFEYYGKLDNGTSYNEKGDIIEDMYKGIFGYWNGNENQRAQFRFGIQLSDRFYIKWNSAYLSNTPSDYSLSSKDVWNIYYPIKNFQYGDDIYYTIILDTSSSYKKDGIEYYRQTFYRDGQKLYEGGYNKRQWEDFINNHLNNLKYFCIGRCSMSGTGYWHYSKMNAYTLRLYNKALTSDQVIDNYNKSIAYYETLKK